MVDTPLIHEREPEPGAPLHVPQGGYWADVGRRFFKKKWAVLGLCALLMLCFLAVFAPFLAGNRPLIFRDDDSLSLPVFAAFTAEDFLWLSFPGIVIVFWPFGRLLRRRERKEGRTHSGPGLQWMFTAILVLAAIVIALLWPEKLDRSDFTAYRDGAREASICVMPPVPWSPQEISLSDKVQAPSGAHWLGTDPVGRDVLSRLIHGTRVSLLVGFVAVILYVVIGVVMGALAGFFGGWTDMLISRLIEVVICFPAIFAILAVLCFLPPSVFWIMILIGLLRWPRVARLTRGEFLRLRNEDFVTSSRALGLSNFRIIFFQILPNSLAPVLVAATFGIAGAILLESGLSFLGFGVQPPMPSWGEMLASGRAYFDRSWWLTLCPGLAIFLAVTAFNLIGEGLRDALDPKLKL
jgi:peptide/nickel transport system permease protein